MRAGEAVIALGAWATSWRRFRPYLTIRGSYMVVTEPAPERLAELNWTGGEAVRDQRASIHYLRTTPDGRIAIGLGGVQRGLARDVGPSFAFDEGFVRKVAGDLHELFPSFADVPIAAGWGGPINVVGPEPAVLRDRDARERPPRPGLHGQRRRALAPGREDPRVARRSMPTTSSPGCRSSGGRRSGSRPSRSVPQGCSWRTPRSGTRTTREAGGGSPDPVTRLVATAPRRLGYNLGPRR